MRTQSSPWFVIAGLPVYVSTSAVICFIILSIVMMGAGVFLLNLSFGAAVILGIGAALLHYGSEVLHNIGHSIAARSTGYPMRGIRLWFLVGTCLYPADEPELPAKVHIRRAFGGPTLSALITAVAAGLLLFLPLDGVVFWLLFWFFLDNLLVFSLGALLPLKIGPFQTDGSTILYWLRHPPV